MVRGLNVETFSRKNLCFDGFYTFFSSYIKFENSEYDFFHILKRLLIKKTLNGRIITFYNPLSQCRKWLEMFIIFYLVYMFFLWTCPFDQAYRIWSWFTWFRTKKVNRDKSLHQKKVFCAKIPVKVPWAKLTHSSYFKIKNLLKKVKMKKIT